MKHLLPKLTHRLKGHGSKGLQVSIPKWRNVVPEENSSTITHAWLWAKMGSFLKPKDVVVSETGMGFQFTSKLLIGSIDLIGTSSFGALEIVLPRDTIYLSQVLWGSIGWTVGGYTFN
jgi:pyruvate decarboxylase